MVEIKLDLSKEEEQGYYSLLAFSQLSIGEFCFFNKFEHKQGVTVLNTLKEKKLVTEVKGLSDRYIPQFPFLNIADKFREPIEKFNVLKTNLDTFFQTKEQEIAKSQQDKIKQVNDAINPKISELDTSDKTLKAETDKRTNDLTAEMKTADENFIKGLGENRSKSKADVDAKKSSLVTQTTAKESESEKKVLMDSKTLKESTNTVITSFFKQVDDSIYSEIVKSFETLKTAITSLNSEIASYEKKFNDDSSNWLQSSQTKGESGLSNSQKSFSTFITNSKNDVATEKSALNLLNLEFKEINKFEEIELAKPFLALRNALELSVTEVNKVRDAFNDQITQIIQTDTKNTQDLVNNSKITLNQTFATIIDTRTKQGESIAKQLSDGQTKNITQAQGFVKTQTDEVTQQETASKTAITNTKTDLKAKHTKASEDTQTQITSITSKVLPELNTNVTNWNQNFKTTFDSVTKTTTDQYTGISQAITQIMADVKAQYEQNAKEITAVTTSTKDTYTKSFNESMAVMKKKLDEVTAQLQQMHADWTSKTTNTFEDLLNKIHTQLQQLATKQNEVIQSKFAGLQTQIPPKQTVSVDSFKKVNSQVEAEITKLQKILEAQINGTKTLLETHKKAILTDLPEKISVDLDTVSNAMTQHAATLKTQMNTFLTEWSNTTKVLIDNWVTLEVKLRTDEEGNLKSNNNSLSTSLDDLNKKASSLRVDLITNAKNQNKTLNESLNKTIITASNSLSSSYDEALTTLDSNLTEFNENSENLHAEQLASLKESYDEIKKSLAKLLQTTRSTTDQKIQEQNSSVTKASETAQNSYKENKEESLTTVNTNIIQTFTNIDTTNQEFYKGLLEIQNGFVTDMGTTISNFESSLSDLTINQMKSLIASLQEKFAFFSQTQDALSKSIASFIQTESTVRQSLTQGVNEQAKLLQQNLKDHAGEFQAFAKAGEDNLTPPSSLLDKFNGLVKDYAYPQIDSAGIIGWSGSIVQVQNMIKSMKTRVTLLVPNPNDVDSIMEAITNAKRPKRIDLSCQFDLNNKEHQQLIRKLLGQDNITLRNLEIGKVGGTETKYPPFLAVDRDGEEVMFGTQDPTNKTAFVGMVSHVGSFIELMGKVVLSDFLSKAKKINPGDV